MSERSLCWIDLPAELADQFGASTVSLPGLAVRGQAVVIKENPQRVIYRVHLCGQDLHVKLCRTRGWRDRMRDWLRGPKARLEYSKLQTAAARDVPTARAIAAGSRPGESYLITATIAGSEPLAAFLAKQLHARSRIQLSVALGRFLAHVHHAGIRHPDLHPGNILIRWEAAHPELFLLDLHDARIGRPLGDRASIDNLVEFNRWFILRTNRADRLRCWRTYVTERFRLASDYVVDYERGRDLERQTWTSNLRFWRRRSARCLGTNRRFRRFQAGAVAGFAAADLADGDLVPLLRDPDALFSDAPLLKDSQSSTVVIREFMINGQARGVICKRFRRRSWVTAIAALFRPSACRRSWVNGHGLLDCLLPTARPLAMCQRLQYGLPFDGYLVAEFIPHAIDLRRAVTGSTPTQKPMRIEMIARLVRDLHQRGWSNRDLKAANILLAPGADGRETPWFIDLAGVRRPIWLTRARRVKDLARLNASFHDLPQLSRTDRLRFLRLYLNLNLHARREWKKWWREVQTGTERKIAKNRRRGRPLA